MAMPTSTPQPGIFDESVTTNWTQQYTVDLGADIDALRSALARIRGLVEGDRGPASVVIAVGASLLGTLAPDLMPAGIRPFTAVMGTDGHSAPDTQDDLLVWFGADGSDRCLLAARLARELLDGVATLRDETPGFTYFDHLDLTGFEDGTENPTGDDRYDVAVVPDGPAVGSSHVLVQRWVHDLIAFEALDVSDQELVIGRTKDGSVELEPVPEASHIERVVMKDADGDEREIYRRSFPYGDTTEHGLLFLAFGADLSTFVDMLDRMYGVADGVRDRLTDISRAVSGAFYVALSEEALDRIVTPSRST